MNVYYEMQLYMFVFEYQELIQFHECNVNLI